jgi:cell division septation protein DedD
VAKKQRRRSTRKTAKSGTSPVIAMLFGLAVGLSVAVAVYVKDRQPGQVAGQSGTPEPRVTETTPTPASMQDALDDNGEAAGETPAKGEAEKEKRFTFYDILPNFEVVTPDEEPATAVGAAPQAVVEPGVYVLQAGSFSTNTDADRRRAELALHGIESHIQRVKVNERNYHRVYIGPIDDLDELNLMRSRLRAAKIDVFRIRLSDD